MAIELIRRGQSQIYGQVGVGLKGQTWINLADAGDTSPQTVENLGADKTYLLINSEGANVEIDTVDTPTPVKLTEDTEFDFVWASGKIALYELSAEETALDASVLGQKYHYVSDTKSTNSVRVKSVGKSLLPLIQDDWEQGTIGKVGGEPSATTERLRTKSAYKIPVNQNLTFSVASGFDITGVYLYDKIGNFLSVYSAPFTSPTTETFVKFVIRKSSNSTIVQSDILNAKPQLEEGNTATAYEPYKESSAIINLPEPLRSLPNGVKDEVSVTSGVRTQNNKSKVLVSDDFVSLYKAYINIDVVIIKKPADYILYNVTGSSIANSQTIYFPEFRPISGVSDNLSDIGGLYNQSALNFAVTVAKGTYANLAAAQTALVGKSLIYQLATPVVEYFDPQPLQIFPNGNRWVEFANKEVAVYNTGIHVANTDLPIREMIKVDKIGLLNGRWYRESVDLANVTVAPDGLSFTIDGATSGPYEQYEFEYYYDSALSTLPELVIPDEPSLVTIKNRNISL